DWLDHYTFPLESKCSDLNYSKTIYDSLVKELLSQGTTTALMFGTIYNDSNIILAKDCLEYGLRGFIGQVAMDNADQTPAYY
ncbi:amidohydrolase family protein, partial [Lactobacillus paragasseri]